MQVTIVAVGKKMPRWVVESCDDYLSRTPREFAVSLLEVDAERRVKNQSVASAVAKEGERVTKAIPAGDFVIALDERGKSHTTKGISAEIERWQMSGVNVSFLIGGADGLADTLKQSANEIWSLSALTLPHPMVRTLLAEQLYRAWSLYIGHPYHRE